MSSSSIHCAKCHSQHPPRLKTAKLSCKNVKILMKTVERGTSPMKLIAPCGAYDDLPFNARSRCPSPQPSVQEHSYCPYHNRGQGSTMMDAKFCCTPTTQCNECKCHETCVTHGSSCPYGSDNPFRARSSARVDPDPLE